jgi:hypothetical protein
VPRPPHFAAEPPPGYIAFVARHLDPLRSQAAQVVGVGQDADQLYPDVLMDVATRWGWLELARTRLHRPDAAERYLRRAFARRAQRWESEERWASGEGQEPAQLWGSVDRWAPARPEPEVSFEVTGDWPADGDWPGDGDWRAGGDWPMGRPPVRPVPRTSVAVRLAPRLVPTTSSPPAPVAEAAIAWWHAYEARRRRRWWAVLVVGLVLVAVLRG